MAVKNLPNQHSTEAASALHRFNRYEIKYLMEKSLLPELRERLQQRMQADSHQSSEGASLVSSLYYDSRDLRCYWEKIEGLRLRRKLRIRAYGDPETISDESTVFVEIKQRVKRVTHKRRIALSYADARVLCDERLNPDQSGAHPEFVDEVLTFIRTQDLQPTTITSYQREAYIGVDADTGVRITMDHEVRGRTHDFYLGTQAGNQLIIPPHLAIVELKANERAPAWFSELATEINLDSARISKYCKSIEAHHMGASDPQHTHKFSKPP